MPATAGRVRMPANNRVHSSAALQTHGIWQSAIGYDPYAPDQKQPPPADRDAPASLSAPTADQQNTYDSFQGLLALARLTGSNADEARGACRRCGRVGHLPFQCRNFLKDESAILASAIAVGSNGAGHVDAGNLSSHKKDRTHDKGSRKGQPATDSSSEVDDASESDDSGLSDSSADSEMERAIAAKFGKNIVKTLCKKSRSAHSKDPSSHRKSHSKKSKSKKDENDGKHNRKSKHSSGLKRSRSNISDSESDESSEEEHRKKRRRSHKHGSSRSKNHSKHLDDSSERKRGNHSKKQKFHH
ncbi:hypothetical protein L7F22_024925 [Adiantum nelumboides]|nr:hypothetical protein [Adiantum nelumboides]